jgi:glycine/D-amino acid oxidase-like deaminating enzyme
MTNPSNDTPVNALSRELPSDIRPHLTIDMDVDVCVVGAGVAGLTVAREAARRGASVAVLETRQVGWGASGHNLGTVMPGYGVPVTDLIERVGLQAARELWTLSEEGVDTIRSIVATDMPDMTLTAGALEVSTTDAGDRLVGWLQTLNDGFGADVEGWQTDRVRDVLKTKRYFHALHFPKALQIDGLRYVHNLARLAENAGVKIFENTPVVSMDSAGVRKRIVTPSARLRAGHIVLAGNFSIGTPALRLSSTLMPVWRYAAITTPLGDGLKDVMSYQGSVLDDDGIDHFRIVSGDRLLWSSFETTWPGKPQRYSRAIRQRIKTIFPQLPHVRVERVWSSAFGQSVHGMPQIGQLKPGLWVLSGFGRQGLNTSAMGGTLIAAAIMQGDDRWRQFSPFELVWAGGTTGKMVMHAAGTAIRAKSAALGAVARLRERAIQREAARDQRRAERVAATHARTQKAQARSGSDERYPD